METKKGSKTKAVKAAPLTPTPHNAAKAGEIAATVLMPGDPLRAKYIAETFLKDAKLVNTVRNMFCYTGTYNGKAVSVMGSGMGMPSIGIYASELYKFYGVKRIIRIGTCGSFAPDLDVFDTILAVSASTTSSWANQYELPGTYSAAADFNTLLEAYDAAKELKIPCKVKDILSEDNFYNEVNPDLWKKWARMGIAAVEMESYALYCIAKILGKEALTILSVSDSFLSHKVTTAEERVTGFTNMMKIALSCIKE